ncbi:MAG: hypothetical protein KKC72_08345 [Alphaproteobacteria bacterium]|nr:hypothetical protein [Alphaproteobacteria bacterium]MBU1836259.1 hypothetical protein [Alphaproteobacteria bacterium]
MRANSNILLLPLAISIFGVLLAVLSIYFALHSWELPEPVEPGAIAIENLKSEIYSKFFEIFVVISGLLGTLSAILGIGTYAILKSSVEKAVEHSINERIVVSQARVIAISFNENAFSWFRQYEPSLQKFLCGSIRFGSEDHSLCLEQCRTANFLASQGLDPFYDLDEQQKSHFLNSVRGKKALINILNQLVYSEAAILLLSNERPTMGLVSEIDTRAEQLLELAVDRKLAEDNYNWWEAVETVGFFRAHIGKKFGHDRIYTSGSILIRY